ncbi:glycosyltransferase [Glaciimonas immobilis]|uniref:Glycosyltransferase subfamily 4-like N-terminal domain-containing protein n=1 Tax=Glaciimonas immobilis TaxID=728004 RepID=A0A840RRM0_9BURK|nr:glycosyltransferase family 4 protein [Glaciimonas immobilis]KAF3998163.1 glycosyltransferase [Glaciimonas immobilis]MBB5199129.1 hypothetical protein [Glaciimonas immobilis]
MRIVVLSPDIPFPANRGGRADIWRRIQAMSSLGHEVMLVASINSEHDFPSKEVHDVIASVVTTQFLYPIKRNFVLTVKRLLGSFWRPLHTATRVPDTHTYNKMLESVRTFKPDALWLDGPWLGVLAERFSDAFKIPLLYRSHNVESIYMRGQACVAVRRRDRLALHLSCIGLRNFEQKILQRATAVFDISVDDLNFWKKKGMQHMHWLPPLPELAFRGKPENTFPCDLVFVGNLATPNNVRGVEWLVNEVLPLIREQFPNISCRIVGSNPTMFVRQILQKVSNVELCADVPDSTPYLFGARVLVNPVMTGSGVQVKMLDMLMTDTSIVTTSQGTRGLPFSFKLLFRIADGTVAFAKAVCEELHASSVSAADRAEARETFSVAAVGHALEVGVPQWVRATGV